MSGHRRHRRRNRAENSGAGLRKKFAGIFAILLLTGVIILIKNSIGSFQGAASSAAQLSAKLMVPQGGAKLITENIEKFSSIFNKGSSTVMASAEQQTGGMEEGESDDDLSWLSSGSSSPSPSSSAVSAVSGGKRPVKTLLFGPQSSDNYEMFQNICVYNQTKSHKADIKNQLAIRPDVTLFKKKGPQVLIVHTHTTESYASSDLGYYEASWPTRTPDKSKSIVKVGDEIAKSLEAQGIGVIHDTTYHDYPSFDFAYKKSLATIEKNLKKYPSIQVVLDIHRDAIQYADGTRAKPTAVINGKKAAQLMVVSACNEDTALPVPDWQYNYRFGLRLQQKLVKMYPNLARPLNLCPRRYNMQATHGSLLVEFGTDVNTLDEAAYSGELFGNALAQTLMDLKK